MILALLEGSLLFAAVAGGIIVWGSPVLTEAWGLPMLIWQALVPPLCCIVAFYYNDLYDLRIVRSFGEFASRLLQSFGLALILLAAFYTGFPAMRISQGPLLTSLLLSWGCWCPPGWSLQRMRHRAFADRVLILGPARWPATLITEIVCPSPLRYSFALADDG